MKFVKSKFGLLSLLIVFGTSIFFISCEQDLVPEIMDQTQETINDTKEVKEERSALAKHLSVLITEQPELNEVLKEMIDEEVEKGYYEKEIFFNIKKEETSNLLNGSTLSYRLSSSNNESINKTIDYLAINDPGLAILMIGDKNSTVFNSRIYVDNGFDDSDPNSQIEYYENGVLGSHGISEQEPTALTFIVRESEAYLTSEELLLEDPKNISKLGIVEGKEIHVFGYNSDKQNSQLKEVQTIQSSKMKAGVCDRDNFEGKEQMHAFKTSDRKEPSWRGSGEFVFIAVFGDNSSDLNSLQYRKEGVWENTWYTIDWDLFTWEANNDLDRMKYRIVEEDGSATIDFTLSLKGKRDGVEGGGEITVSIPQENDFVGEALIQYCDPIHNSNHNNTVTAGVATLRVRQTGENITNGPTHNVYDVRFKSSDGQFLEANSGGYAYCRDWHVQPDGIFTIKLESNGTFAIKGNNGKYADVHVGGDSRIWFVNDNPYCTDCRFIFEDTGDGYRAIKNLATGKYLASEGLYDDVPVRANRNEIQHWEKWEVINYDF